MNPNVISSKSNYAIWVLALLVLAALLTCLLTFYPIECRKAIIHATCRTKWTEYQQLTKMLSIGMDSTEAAKILGQPDSPIITQSNVQCWTYSETGPTAGWLYIAEFKPDQTNSQATRRFKLCYTANIEHTVFTNLGFSEIGRKISLDEPNETFVFGFLRHK